MKASVIVPVRKNRQITQCVASLLNQQFDDEFEIIIVENDRNMLLKDEISSLPVIYAVEPRTGSYWARNNGIMKAKYEIIAFTDADCVVAPEWLQQLVNGFDDNSIGGVAGKTINEESDLSIIRSQRNVLLEDGLQHLNHIYHAPYAPTCNIAYRSSVLKALNGFDGNFKSGGDVDIAWRMERMGLKMAYAPKAIVHFGCRKTIKDYYKQYYGYGIGHVQLFEKFRYITGKKYILNFYSVKLMAKSTWKILIGIVSLKNKDYLLYHLLNFTEGLAIFNSSIIGSLKHRLLYV